jgi:hypothetical protein
VCLIAGLDTEASGKIMSLSGIEPQSYSLLSGTILTDWMFFIPCCLYTKKPTTFKHFYWS